MPRPRSGRRALCDLALVRDESIVTLPTRTFVRALCEMVGFRGHELKTQCSRRTRVRFGALEQARRDARAARARRNEEIFEDPHRALRERRVGGEEMRERNRLMWGSGDVKYGLTAEAVGNECRRAREIDGCFVKAQIVTKERHDFCEIVESRALDRQATNFGNVARMRSIAVLMASSEFA